jgi:hypothetical protein
MLVTAGSLGTVGTATTGVKTDLTEVRSEIKEEPVISDSELALSDKDVQPVGQDYIEEIKNEEGEQSWKSLCHVDWDCLDLAEVVEEFVC